MATDTPLIPACTFEFDLPVLSKAERLRLHDERKRITASADEEWRKGEEFAGRGRKARRTTPLIPGAVSLKEERLAQHLSRKRLTEKDDLAYWKECARVWLKENAPESLR